MRGLKKQGRKDYQGELRNNIMKELALAILVVGLCFYNLEIRKKYTEYDWVASLITLIGSIVLLCQFIQFYGMKYYIGEKDNVDFHIDQEYISDEALEVCKIIFEKKKDVWYN